MARTIAASWQHSDETTGLMSFSRPRVPAQVSVNMDAPSVRTRLLTPPLDETSDYSFIYISVIVTRNVSQTRPVTGDTEKFRRNTPSPVWMERNSYCGEQDGGGVVK
ncbi:hypothetical protein TELCIR_07500 [Teladorsagia circumcincta]|uniref:Uncharacterized protein n=1 Tax=Teladorsagia circumcincta TaxID=45464 RepID=A0A2G9UKG5_TELCI|nr:hypothetical protein TELCIR_07500 [Teladorsagia circumcincta]